MLHTTIPNTNFACLNKKVNFLSVSIPISTRKGSTDNIYLFSLYFVLKVGIHSIYRSISTLEKGINQL